MSLVTFPIVSNILVLPEFIKTYFKLINLVARFCTFPIFQLKIDDEDKQTDRHTTRSNGHYWKHTTYATLLLSGW